MTDVSHPAKPDMPTGKDDLAAVALELLLRSPRLTLPTVLRLLDLTEPEFRAMVKAEPALGALLRQRQQGLLELPETDPRKCSVCKEWFLPYGGARQCSDACRSAARIEGRAFREEARH